MLVYYCPGDSIGSPAWILETEAHRQIARDREIIRALEETDGRTRYQPHIGGECLLCKLAVCPVS